MEELIEKYFEKSLSKEEQSLFEEKIKTEPVFKEELDFQISLRAAIHLKERNELKHKLQGFDKIQNKSSITVSASKKNKWYFIAAAAVIAIVSGIYFYSLSANQPDKSLYMAYHEVYPNIIAPNVRGENATELKNKAFMAYDAENYEEAILLFNQIKEGEYAVFYTGISNLELNKPQKTIASFSKTNFSDSSFPFETYRKWYLALAYLKINDIEACKKELKELTQTDNIQKVKAGELLKEL